MPPKLACDDNPFTNESACSGLSKVEACRLMSMFIAVLRIDEEDQYVKLCHRWAIVAKTLLPRETFVIMVFFWHTLIFHSSVPFDWSCPEVSSNMLNHLLHRTLKFIVNSNCNHSKTVNETLFVPQWALGVISSERDLKSTVLPFGPVHPFASHHNLWCRLALWHDCPAIFLNGIRIDT